MQAFELKKRNDLNSHSPKGRATVGMAIAMRLLVAVVFVLLSPAIVSRGQEARGQEANLRSVDWLSGRQLDASLRLPVTVSWVNAPLRDLSKLSRQQRIAVIFDRRIDPTQLMTFSAAGITMEQLLWKMGDQFGFSVCRIEDAFYIGPEQSTARLPALLEATKSLRKRAKEAGKPFPKRWKSRSTLAWPILSTPSAVLKNVAKKGQIKIQNPDAIPHDLWPAQDWPALSLEARIGLNLVGFDLWFQPENNGREILIRKFPKIKSGTETLPNVSDAKTWTKTLKELYPNCKFQTSGKSIQMTGDVKTLQEMRREVGFSQKPEIVQGAETKYSFSIDQPARRSAILKQFTAQLNLELEIPESATEVMNQTIKVKVKEKSLNEVIAQLLEGTGLTFTLSGGNLKITQ